MNCNIHPLFRDALAPFAPVSPSKISDELQPMLRDFDVTIYGAGLKTIVVEAFTTCDAVCKAIEIFFDGDEPMPTDGLRIDAFPSKQLPRAA